MSMLAAGLVVGDREACALRQQQYVEPVLRHVDSTEALFYHPRAPSLLMRARALATLREWKKRLDTKLIRGLVTEAATDFQSRRRRCRQPIPVTPHYAPFPTYKAEEFLRARSLASRQRPGSRGLKRCGLADWLSHPKTIDPAAPSLAILRPVWERLGYTEPDGVVLRAADGDPARLAPLVNELVGLGIGVLIAVGPAAVKVASAARSVPVVAIDLETDPVLSGLAASFGRPGGNVTGLFMDQPSLAGKLIDLLREAAPGVDRLAFLWDPTTTRGMQLASATEAARIRGVPAVTLEVRSPEDYQKAFADDLRIHTKDLGVVHLRARPAQALMRWIAAAARKHRLPTIAFLEKFYARSGVLF